jgi:hypothetical protein
MDSLVFVSLASVPSPTSSPLVSQSSPNSNPNATSSSGTPPEAKNNPDTDTKNPLVYTSVIISDPESNATGPNTNNNNNNNNNNLNTNYNYDYNYNYYEMNNNNQNNTNPDAIVPTEITPTAVAKKRVKLSDFICLRVLGVGSFGKVSHL